MKRSILFCLITALVGFSMQSLRAEDYQNVVSHDIVHLGRQPATPVHAPNLLDTGKSLLAVHGVAKVGGSASHGAIYRSTDDGKTWTQQHKLPTYHCGSFFQIDDTVYLLYADFRHDNKTKIRKSQNDGVDWSEPVVIYPKALWDGNGAYARHNGFLYKALDEKQPEDQDVSRSLPRVLKIKLQDDPMNPDNWIFSSYPNFAFPPPKPVRDPWTDKRDVRRNNGEGNCVVGPDGKVWIIYRHFERTRGIFSATVFFDDETNTQHFRNVYDPDPEPAKANCYSQFPGACSGFHIAYDEQSGKYIALSNPVTGATQHPNGRPLGIYRCMRNVLVMMESEDLIHWRIAKHLMKDGLEKTWEQSVKRTGFQQVNFEIQDDDLIWISRTAYDGAKNLHDANRITFHRLPDFRQYLDPDGEVVHYNFDDAEHLGQDQCKQAGPGANSGNVATPINVQQADGRINGAAAFNGKDSRMDVHYRISTELHRASAVTIAGWIFLETSPDDETTDYIFESAIHKGYAAVDLGISGNNIVMGARSCRQDAYQKLTSPLPAKNKWVHLSAIYDFSENRLELYVGGRRVERTDCDFKKDVLMRAIPREKDAIGTGLSGRIDELHIYKKRLTPDAIKQLSNPGTSQTN